MVPDGCNYKSLPKEYQNTRNFHVAWTRFAKDKPAPTIDTGHRHHFFIISITEFQQLENVQDYSRSLDDFIFRKQNSTI